MKKAEIKRLENPNVLPITGNDDLTEQEHKDSCDINKMISTIATGQEVRGKRSQPQYGSDDTTMSGLDFRIAKQKLEDSLAETSETHEFTELELSYMPPEVAKKYQFKKAAPKTDDKTNEPNEPKQSEKAASKTTKTSTSGKTTDE